jgi:hypothetical protein
MGARCRSLRGAKAPHHRLVANDVGHTLGVVVRATDSAGSTNGYASLIGPVAGARSPLVSVIQPNVSGAAALGGIVHVDTGKWSHRPKSLTYQWIRCNANGRACAPIVGDRTASHTLVRRDVAHALIAIVQARSRTTAVAVLSRGTTRISGATAPAPAPAAGGPTATAPPSVVARAVQQGKQLTGVAGTWAGSGTIQFAYQWYRCDAAGAHCKSVHGSTKPTYTQVAKDVGSTLGFAVRATDANGTTSAYASLVGPVAAAASPLVSTAQPTVSGTAAPGQTLQVSPGSWNQTPTVFGYRWQSCNPNGRLCTAIAGATAATYTVTAADAGHTLLAVVQATAAGLTLPAISTGMRTSAAPTGPAASVRPAVAGISQQGKQLTGVAGTWAGSGTIQFAYQWYRCDAAGAHCKSVHGSTKPTYTQVAKDVGSTLGFAVRATDANGTTSAYASLVGPVAAAASPLVSTAQPTVSGTAAPGQTLQVSPGSWNQTPTVFGYRWQSCNPNGRLCTAIAGATAATYTVTAADAGHTLLAVVQATAAGLTLPAISTGVPVG